MSLRIAVAGLSFAMLAMASGSALAAESTAPTIVSRPAEAVAEPLLVPADFAVPTKVETAGFKLVPLGPEVVNVDFDAYMSSIKHLQETFTRSTDWPRENISMADAMLDMENEQRRFKERKSFAYAVLTLDGSRERGSVYVSPGKIPGYDAVVRLWVTKAEYDDGFDAELYAWVTNWIRTDWPFEKVAYPGRAMDWATWDALIANQSP